MIVMTASYGLSCAKRNNPFDPINYQKPKPEPEPKWICPPESLITLKKNVIRLLADADNAILLAQKFADSMHADSFIQYNIIISANSKTIVANQSKNDSNQIVDSINQISLIIDSLHLKPYLLDTLLPIAKNQIYLTTFNDKMGQIETIQLKIRALIAGFELSCSETKDSARSFKDSVTGSITNDSLLIGGFIARSIALFQSLYDSSAVIARYNASIVNENAKLTFYNENIQWLLKSKYFPHAKSLDSLQAYISHAVPGDTFIIQGELRSAGHLFFDTSGTALKPIVLMGSPQMTSVISAAGGIIIQNRQHISLENLVIRNSTSSGFKAEGGASAIVLKNCIIRDNLLYGVEAVDSDLQIDNCKIINNGKSGLRFSRKAVNQIDLDNVLIIKNRAHGIELINPEGDLNYVTISNNDSSGIYIPFFSQSFTIYNSLITYNNEFGIKATVTPGKASLINLRRNDNFYGNRLGDIDTTGHYSYFTLEPGYIDTAANNFSINPHGPMQGYDIGYREKQ